MIFSPETTASASCSSSPLCVTLLLVHSVRNARGHRGREVNGRGHPLCATIGVSLPMLGETCHWGGCFGLTHTPRDKSSPMLLYVSPRNSLVH